MTEPNDYEKGAFGELQLRWRQAMGRAVVYFEWVPDKPGYNNWVCSTRQMPGFRGRTGEEAFRLLVEAAEKTPVEKKAEPKSPLLKSKKLALKKSRA